MISLPNIQTEERISLLLAYLDTFYVDPDAWNFLSELYASQSLSVSCHPPFSP